MTAAESHGRRFFLLITSGAFWLAALANLAFGVYFMSSGNAIASATAYGAAIALVVISTIDRFETFKAFGVEAKLKRLDSQIQEAEKTVGQLRRLAELSGRSLVGLLAGAGRFDSGPTNRSLYEQGKQIEALMLSVGVESAAIERAMSPWVWTITLDMTRHAMRPYIESLQRLQQQVTQEANAFPRPILSDDPRYLALTERARAIGLSLASASDSRQWPVEERARRIVSEIERSPWLSDAEEKKVMLQAAQSIADEVDSLVRTRELKSPDRWFAVEE